MASQSQYTSTYPEGIQIDEGIRNFFEEFYKISDTRDKHEEYARSFTKDATLVMGIKKATGFDEILKFRKGMWEVVASRSHNPVKVFPFGSGEGVREVMLHGTVAYELKDKRKAEVDWAARANLVKEEGEWKMSYYQVYLDSAAMQNAK